MKKLFLAIGMMLMSTAAHAEPPLYWFPEVTADNLNEQSVTLPNDFSSNANVVIIAFEREQQALVDPWLARLAEYQSVKPAMDYYELPTMDRFTSFGRWFIAEGMRSGIEDEAQRARTISLHLEDKPAFTKALGIADESTIHTLVLQRGGGVLTMQKGAFTEDKWRDVQQYIDLALDPNTQF